MENLNKKHLNWVEAYQIANKPKHSDFSEDDQYYKEKTLSPEKIANFKYFQAILNIKDSFIPPSISKFIPEEIKNILTIENQIYQEQYNGLPFLRYYRNILGKISTLIAEQNPDCFENLLSIDEQQALLSWKMSIPDENTLMEVNFPYLLGQLSGPYLFPGEDFSRIVKRLSNNQNLSDKLNQVYAEYITEYLRRKKTF